MKQYRGYVWLILAVALIHAVVRIYLPPVWAKYDEPTHFEKVIFVLRDGLNFNLPDDTIAAVIASTFEPKAVVGNCTQLDVSPCFRPKQQIDEMPLFYVLQAGGQALYSFDQFDTRRVYTGRWISAGLFLLTVWVGYKTAEHLYPEEPFIFLGVPLAMALLFPFVDLMTAINNDVGAVTAMSFFFFAWVRAIDQDDWPHYALVGLATVICLFTKTTAWLAVPLLAVFIIIRVLPRKTSLILLACGAGIGLVWAGVVLAGVKPIPDGLNKLLTSTIRININQRVRGLREPGSLSYYGEVVRWLFVTFWGGFGTGWDGISRGLAAVFAVITAGGIAGWVYGIKTNVLELFTIKNISLWLTIVMAILMNIARASPPESVYAYIATARHMYVAIIPVMIVLLVGLNQWLDRSHWRYGLAGTALLLTGVAVWSVFAAQLPIYATWPVP